MKTQKPWAASCVCQVSFDDKWDRNLQEWYMLCAKFVETFYIQHSGKHFVSPGSHPEIIQPSPPKPGWGQKRECNYSKQIWRMSGQSGWGCVDGQRETRTRLTAFSGWKQSSSLQWSTKQSVYCEVGLIPGEEEKWFLLTGRKLTLSSLFQGRCWISTLWLISLVGFKGGWVSMSATVLTLNCSFLAALAGFSSGKSFLPLILPSLI